MRWGPSLCFRYSTWNVRPRYTLSPKPFSRCLSTTIPTQAFADHKPHYTTTPIFYVNASPHIGHLHSAVLADVFSRWAQWRHSGYSDITGVLSEGLGETKAVLATGTDEHGIKIQKVAEANNESPRELCDRVSQRFESLAEHAGVQYTRFIRTTDGDHVEAVNEFWKQLEKGGFIYKGTHEGWYSVSDEAFYTAAQIRPNEVDSSKMESIETGSAVEWSSEENYKFKLSAFQQPLLDWLDANPDAVVPASRRDTLIAEITQGLSDLSVSRPRSRLHWGIPVPSDEHHTIYVWLDALTNYLTVSGYPWKNEKMGCWPTDVQVIGKDIIRFHAIYFPAFLMALNLPLPKHTVAHGHWTMNKHKMSKSRGNVADPFKAIEKYGRDELRWFLCRVGGNLGSDADWSESTFLEFHAKFLSGQWGNLASRIMGPKVLAPLFGDKRVATVNCPNFQEEDSRLLNVLHQLTEKVDEHMDNFEVNRALDTISEALARANEHLTLLEPWRKSKSKKQSDIEVVQRSVYLTLETLRLTALLARPVLPNKMVELLNLIQVDEIDRKAAMATGLRTNFTLVKQSEKIKILFPRIEAKESSSEEIV